MFIVKTYSAEGFEQSRFEKLASADAKARLKKKRMKAFIPEAVTAIYATMALVFFSVASWAMSCGSLAGPNVVSFMTSLVLLIDPIQVHEHILSSSSFFHSYMSLSCNVLPFILFSIVMKAWC